MSNLHLFVACVAIWGATWIAITYQLGEVPPEASVFYRFLLASILIFAYCLARGMPLRYRLRAHAWIALFGVFMFSAQYLFIYYAEQQVVSGLVAVGYSAVPLLSMFGMRIFFGSPMTQRVAVGALFGIVGIALVFLPEFGRVQGGGSLVLGATYTAIAVLVATLGSMVAHRNQEAQLPLWQSLAWGMLYGALCSLIVLIVAGKALAFETTGTYVASLLYLAVFGSIIAFGGYLTLLKRIGAARAGYIGVMVPVVALVISAAFEGFRWEAATWIGIAVSVAGNVVILRERAA